MTSVSATLLCHVFLAARSQLTPAAVVLYNVSFLPLCGESPGTRDPHSKVHHVRFPPRAGVCLISPLGLGDGEAQLARRPEAHSAPVAKTRQTRRDAQDSDAPHACGLTTQHCPTPRSCVSLLSLRLVVCRPAVSCATRNSTHWLREAVTSQNVCCTRLPPPPASFVLRRCAPAVTSARAFLSVSSWLTGRYVLENWTISRCRGGQIGFEGLRFSLALLLRVSQTVRFWEQAMRQMVYPCVKRRWCDVSLSPGRSGRRRIRRDYADVVGTMDNDTISVWRASRSNIA